MVGGGYICGTSQSTIAAQSLTGCDQLASSFLGYFYFLKRKKKKEGENKEIEKCNEGREILSEKKGYTGI